MDEDTKYMEQALHIARKAHGYTSPNPLVGALLVKKGRIIGEGYHQKYGEKHAEVQAIESAIEPVEGATLYCNLEPCCHSFPLKRNPPCTHRIIKEKIRRMVISTQDPNPHVCGNGISTLQQSGVEVKTGILANSALWLNEVYFKFIQQMQPFIHLKIAQSVDGRIATRTGDSKWITDEDALRRVHQLRHQYDAILVGLNTVRIDNPSLTVRFIEGKQPFRVVLDATLSIPLRSKLVSDQFAHKTIIITSLIFDKEKKAVLEKRGVKICPVPENRKGLLNLKETLDTLADLKITSLLVEGGAKVFTQFIEQELFDKISFFIAPLIIGKGIEGIGELDTIKLSRSRRLENLMVETIRDQVIVNGYRNLKSTFGRLAEAL